MILAVAAVIYQLVEDVIRTEGGIRPSGAQVDLRTDASGGAVAVIKGDGHSFPC